MRMFAAIFLMCVGALPAAAGSSDWYSTQGAKLRLIAQPSLTGDGIEAGLEIQLDKGWKTYWRSPGASGLPPQLDLSLSKNIASSKIDFPVPTTFGEGENMTAGYVNSVTFPIAVEPIYPNRPVKLHISGLVGICAQVCVPLQFSLSLDEVGSGQSNRDVALALLQARANMAGGERPDLRLVSARVHSGVLFIEARVPYGTRQSTVLVEGPPSWYLTPAMAESIEGTKAQFRVNLHDIPKNAQPHQTQLIVTLVGDGVGVETRITPEGH